MSVDDSGLEVLRKSGHQVNSGDKSEYYLLMQLLGSPRFTASGARVAIEVVEFEVTDSEWREITLRQSDRNALNIQNRSSANDNGNTSPIYISHSDTDSNSPPIGTKVDGGMETQYAISEPSIFVKAKTGTFNITIEALA